MTDAPKFTPNTSKAVEVIVWIASRSPGIDIYHVVKAAFFADKKHVAQWGRPIIGDSYDAAPYGPLPAVVYGLLKHDPIELLALGGNGDLPFRVERNYRVYPERHPNERRLSKSDIEALEHGVGKVEGRTFDDIYQETHEDPAYVRARRGKMDYREFIPDEDPAKARKAEHLTEIAEYAVF